MSPIMLVGGVILEPHDTSAQQVQGHTESLGLDCGQVFHARRIGKEPTYLVVEWLHPGVHHESLDVVIAHLDALAQEQRSIQQ